MDEKSMLERIKDLLASTEPSTIPARPRGTQFDLEDRAAYQELRQGAVTLISAAYEPGGEQRAELFRGLDGAGRSLSFGRATIRGALKNLETEIQLGLLGTLQKRVTGEVLSDFVQLSRLALEEGNTNVAAVLAAAAFEDTIRRMGEKLIGVIGQDNLADVLKKLKDAGMLQRPQVGIAQGYLRFRNDAMHADWEKIERESVASVLGFVEELLVKHFA